MPEDENITKMIVIADAELPSDIAISAYKVSSDVTIKETCYGLMVTGRRPEVDKVVDAVRKVNPTKIFVKERGFPPGDSRRCRANRGGGPRPGFHQLKEELDLLPNIGKGLVLVERGSKPVPIPEENSLPVDVFKKIIDEEVAKYGGNNT
jgi:putative methanogenesis marker protein 6